jgi:dipeptidyl-peptidase-2
MMLNSRDPLLAIRDVVALFYNATAVSPTCFDIYNDFVECSDTTGCSSSLNSVAFDYQSCIEMPIIQESNSLTDMFPSLSYTVQNRRDYCKRRWNVTIRESEYSQFWNKKVSKVITNLLFVDSVSVVQSAGKVS